MSYHTLRVSFQSPICELQCDRLEAGHTIDDQLIEACHDVLTSCERIEEEGEREPITIAVLEGVPEVFCIGAFQDIHEKITENRLGHQDPEPPYDLWLTLASGPFVTISHVRGKVNAGGVGFVAASDIALAGGG